MEELTQEALNKAEAFHEMIEKNESISEMLMYTKDCDVMGSLDDSHFYQLMPI